MEQDKTGAALSGSPWFETAQDLIDWLDSLYEVDADSGGLTNRKWGPAQAAAAALRRAQHPDGEIVAATGSLNDMAVIKWVSGYRPKIGDWIYASQPEASKEGGLNTPELWNLIERIAGRPIYLHQEPAAAELERYLESLASQPVVQHPAQDEQIEAAAKELWHRFAMDHVIDWESFPHKAEYRAAAAAVLSRAQSAAPAAGMTAERLIDAAEKQAALYDGDDRQDIKADVMNAFYAGAEFARDLLSAAPAAAPEVPKGFTLMPVELTDEMRDAVEKAEVVHRLADKTRGGRDPQLGLSAIYQALRSAAPQPVAAQVGEPESQLLGWAIERWTDEVANRPLINVYRRTLDSTWRQVIRYAGGDDVLLVGPRHDDLVAAAAHPQAAQDNCGNCHKCMGEGWIADRMLLCPTCGNKRCPKASDHTLACTGSNEPGQPGSVYGEQDKGGDK